MAESAPQGDPGAGVLRMSGETTAFWSGHANSSAMVLRMCEIGTPPDRVVHATTRHEFDFVYEFMEKFQKVCPVEIIFEDMAKDRPDKEFENFFHKPWCKGNHLGEIHGFPLQSHPCWHNRNVKQPVYNKYEKTSSEVYTGFHSGERHRAAAKFQFGNHRFPLIEWGWGWKDSLSYLKKRGIPHQGYKDYGFDRLGCWFCPRQGDTELFILYQKFPDLFSRLQDLEEESPHGYRPPGKRRLDELVDIWERKVNHTLREF
jgi:3'-phosphoadenosine 5'-phosphosulfate sulfotransferase (PAPS reductase)/FAD synthetase